MNERERQRVKKAAERLAKRMKENGRATTAEEVLDAFIKRVGQAVLSEGLINAIDAFDVSSDPERLLRQKIVDPNEKLVADGARIEHVSAYRLVPLRKRRK